MDSRFEIAPGLSLSRIITGLWQVADMERDGQTLDIERAAEAMSPYADAGLTTFDMADHYGSAELIAGAFAKGRSGGDVQLLTKWVPDPGASPRESVRDAIQRSLDRLQVETIDLLQYHAWNYANPEYLDDLFELMELRDDGLIRHLGVTNFDTAHLALIRASSINVVSNQVSCSLLDRRAMGAMSDFCDQNGVSILAFGTLAGGFLSDRWLNRPEPESLSTWSQMKYKRYIDEAGGWQPYQHLLGVLDDIAKRHESSIANVATRYVLDQPGVGAVIIGARLGESEHIESNRTLLDLELDDEDRNAIADAVGKLEPLPGDCGDEYRRPPFLTASGDLSHHLETLPPPYPVKTGDDGRQSALSGTVWEDLAGFSRAVRKGDRILVSGTTATHGDKLVGGDNPAAQTLFAIDKIEGAIQSLGGQLEDVVRTRIYIQDIDHWEPVSRTHGQRFRLIQPANTLVRADLIGDGYLVEIEAEAVVASAAG